jgi:hypothetical protein
MEVICSSEKLGDFPQTKLRYIPEDRTLHNHHCENLKSNKALFHMVSLSWLSIQDNQ